MFALRKNCKRGIYYEDVNGYDSTIKYAIMDIVGAINKIESMKQDRYLAMHPYSITHSADGYYRTYLPADDGKRKQIKKIEKRDVPNDR